MTELNKRDYEAIIFALHFDGRTPIIERGFWNYDWKELERKCLEQSKLETSLTTHSEERPN